MFWFTLSPVDFIYGFYSFNMNILNKKKLPKTKAAEKWPAIAYCKEKKGKLLFHISKSGFIITCINL